MTSTELEYDWIFDFSVHSKAYSNENILIKVGECNNLPDSCILRLTLLEDYDERTTIKNMEHILSSNSVVVESRVKSIVNGRRKLLSMRQDLATKLNFTTHNLVQVEIIDNLSKVTINYLELLIKDINIGFFEQWWLNSKLHGRCLHINHPISIDKSTLDLIPCIMKIDNLKVNSGVVDDTTKIKYRSLSSKMYLCIQMSCEMDGFNFEGLRYMDHILFEFIIELLNKWKQNECTHLITVVLFSRNIVMIADDDRDHPYCRNLSKSINGYYYKDYYQVLYHNSSVNEIYTNIDQLFKSIQVYSHNINLKDCPFLAKNTTTIDGNILEMIQICINESDFLKIISPSISIDYQNTSIIVVTPGYGSLDVDYNLAACVQHNVYNSKTCVNLVCFDNQPIQNSPLLRCFELKDDILFFTYRCPSWINVMYYKYDSCKTTFSMEQNWPCIPTPNTNACITLYEDDIYKSINLQEVDIINLQESPFISVDSRPSTFQRRLTYNPFSILPKNKWVISSLVKLREDYYDIETLTSLARKSYDFEIKYLIDDFVIENKWNKIKSHEQVDILGHRYVYNISNCINTSYAIVNNDKYHLEYKFDLTGIYTKYIQDIKDKINSINSLNDINEVDCIVRLSKIDFKWENMLYPSCIPFSCSYMPDIYIHDFLYNKHKYTLQLKDYNLPILNILKNLISTRLTNDFQFFRGKSDSYPCIYSDEPSKMGGSTILLGKECCHILYSKANSIDIIIYNYILKKEFLTIKYSYDLYKIINHTTSKSTFFITTLFSTLSNDSRLNWKEFDNNTFSSQKYEHISLSNIDKGIFLNYIILPNEHIKQLKKKTMDTLSNVRYTTEYLQKFIDFMCLMCSISRSYYLNGKLQRSLTTRLTTSDPFVEIIKAMLGSNMMFIVCNSYFPNGGSFIAADAITWFIDNIDNIETRIDGEMFGQKLLNNGLISTNSIINKNNFVDGFVIYNIKFGMYTGSHTTNTYNINININKPGNINDLNFFKIPEITTQWYRHIDSNVYDTKPNKKLSQLFLCDDNINCFTAKKPNSCLNDVIGLNVDSIFDPYIGFYIGFQVKYTNKILLKDIIKRLIQHAHSCNLNMIGIPNIFPSCYTKRRLSTDICFEEPKTIPINFNSIIPSMLEFINKNNTTSKVHSNSIINDCFVSSKIHEIAWKLIFNFLKFVITRICQFWPIKPYLHIETNYKIMNENLTYILANESQFISSHGEILLSLIHNYNQPLHHKMEEMIHENFSICYMDNIWDGCKDELTYSKFSSKYYKLIEKLNVSLMDGNNLKNIFTKFINEKN